MGLLLVLLDDPFIQPISISRDSNFRLSDAIGYPNIDSNAHFIILIPAYLAKLYVSI